jgi:hypothetical protein
MHRWIGRPRRAWPAWAAVLTLAMTACGTDDGDDASPVTAAASTDTVQDTATTSATEAPNTTAATDTTATEASDTTEMTGASDPPGPATATDDTASAPTDGAVTPTVVCVDTNRFVAYFGYTSDATTSVTIPVGEANRVTLPDGTEVTTQQTDVFAPGDQGVVFWAEVIDPANPPTWTLTSGDGTERSASADSSATACIDRQPPLDPPDDRVASVLGTLDTEGASPRITITVADLADESRCPAGTGWTPEPPHVVVDAGASNATAEAGDDPSTAVFTVDDVALPPSTGIDVVGFVGISVSVDVEDRCTDEGGVTSRAWGASESLRNLSQDDVQICFGVTDDGYGEVDCPGLPATGGIRTR